MTTGVAEGERLGDVLTEVVALGDALVELDTLGERAVAETLADTDDDTLAVRDDDGVTLGLVVTLAVTDAVNDSEALVD